MDNREKQLLQEKAIENKQETYVFIAVILWVFFILYSYIHFIWYWVTLWIIPATILYLLMNVVIFTIIFGVFITSFKEEDESANPFN